MNLIDINIKEFKNLFDGKKDAYFYIIDLKIN